MPATLVAPYSQLVRRLGVAVLIIVMTWAAPAFASADELTVVKEESLTPRLREFVVRSPAMEGETPLRVLLPDGYDPQTPDPYPVLYLLHGCCDDYKSWSSKMELEAITAGKRVLIVMPDAGPFGWYSNWFNNGAGGPPRWEDYHVGELIPWVEKTFRVRTDRQGRAVTGLSMGGFGTMSYAARHPDLFASASSFSGALDTNVLEPGVPTGLDLATIPYEMRPPGSIWGPRATEEVRWRGHNPWDLAENLSTVRLTVRTGNGQPGGEFGGGPDALETYVHQQSVGFHDRLVALGKDHVWEDYGPGAHQWTYWQKDLIKTLPSILEEFEAAPAVDPPFTYKSIEPSYSVYGWHVALERPVLEFSVLNVRPGRFALTGTGKAVVTAPDGQRFDVDLGPAHLVQQYTPAADAQEAVLGADYFKTVEVAYTPTAPNGSRRDEFQPNGTQRTADDRVRLPATAGTSLAGLGVLAAALALRRVRARRTGDRPAHGTPRVGR